jgi:hypothetical protein
VSLLSSPRRRRRLLKLGVALVVVVTAVLLAVFYSKPGSSGSASGPEVAAPKQQRQVPFTKANQQAVHDVLHRFIDTAVTRRDPAGSWNLATQNMRSGITHKQWVNGELPVVPYPAEETKSTGGWDAVEYSYKRSVGVEVFLLPKPGSGVAPVTADVELVKGHDGEWRVDYWMPTKFHGPASAPAASTSKAKAKSKAAGSQPATTTSSRQAAANSDEPLKQSNLWWIVPIAVLSLILLAPIGMGVGIWYRNRKAARQYSSG